MTDKDIKDLLDKNSTLTFLLGYASSIIMQLQSIVENYNGLFPGKLSDKIGWFEMAIDNILYKNIPPPEIP